MTFTDELETELVASVANILTRHGIHFNDAPEDQGWTVEMVGDFVDLMRKQVESIPQRNTDR